MLQIPDNFQVQIVIDNATAARLGVLAMVLILIIAAGIVLGRKL
jgi:hypothetical protein